MILKKQREIIFKNDCGAIFDESLLRKAICWYTSKPVCEIKHIYMFSKYPAVSIYDKKIHIHRLLKMYDIGEDLDSNQYVHHKDGNKLNATLSNLEILESTQHQSLHNKGKVLSEEHRKKIALANKKRKGIKMKKRVDMPNLEQYVRQGFSIKKIANIYGCSWDTVKNRINENEELLK